MLNNRDLLKEAIADAKAVKETAIANAKAALEEAFTPHLKSMLSAKLEEMDIDEDVELEEMDAPSFARKNGNSIDIAPRKVGQTTVQEEEEEVEEEINLDELLAELDLDEETETVNESEEASKEVTEAEEDETEEVEDEEAEEEIEDEEIDLEDMTQDDLKSFIEDVIKDMVEAGELEAGEEMEAEDEELEGDMEIEVEDEEEEIMENENNIEEYGSTSMQEPSDAAAAGLDNIINTLKQLAQKTGPAAKKAYAALQALGAGAGSAMRNESEEESLAEIEELKKELNEVNLLNAKLLYTNKIFKAKNLSEDKKVKVLKAFDKAETVKEAKVIFETLNEGMVSNRPTSMVNEIKGSASKAVGIAPTIKQPIVENDAFIRMQKLAGIIK
jgi:hypothetical protein